MKNSEYWKLRFVQLEEAQNKLANEGCKEIEGIYRQTLKEIEGKIDTWYRRLAKNNEISMAEARKFLSGSELEEFKWDVHDYIKYGKENAVSGQWVKQLENASAKFHISKYEALKIQTQQSFESLFAKQEGITSETMAEVYKSGYYHTAFEIQKGFGFGWDISGIDQSQVEKVLAKPWAVDGKNFSERIWSNKEKLISEVHNELTRNIITGANPQKAIDGIAKKMNTSKYNAGRLVMTEEAYFSSAAQKDCFEDLGVEEYEIVATLDSHTSDICQSMDGKHFPMKDYQAGVTAPPFHVFCRSTTCPWFDEDFGEVGERAARGEDGKTYYVPADMNYKKWKEEFVDGGDKSGLKEVDKIEKGGIMNIERGIGEMQTKEVNKRFAAGNRRSPYYVLNDDEIKIVVQEIEAIGANKNDFVFNSSSTKGTCFLASDGKVHIKGNVFPDEYSDHPRDKMSIRAVLAHEYYGHRPYRDQYLREDNESSPEALNRIFANAWADEFRASYMAAKNAPNLSDEDRYYLIMDSLSRAKEAGVTIRYNNFIRRVLYG